MATWIPNQPVIFGEENNNCSCDIESGAQLVDNTDTTQFQFEIAPCEDAPNFIEDPEFNNPGLWTLGDNWAIAYNQLCHTDGLTYSTVESLPVFQIGHYYKITITIDSMSGTWLSLLLGTNPIADIYTSGTYSFYGFPLGSGDQSLQLLINNPDMSVCISEIKAYEVFRDFKFAIYDANTNGYEAAISYANNPSYFAFVQNTVTVDIDWSELGLSNKCYYICLLDPCENTNNQNLPVTIINPTFLGSANGWTFNGDWSYSSNTMVMPAGAGGDLYQYVFPKTGISYTVIITVTAISGSLYVYFGASQIAEITTTGSHTITGIPTIGLNITLGVSPLDSCTVDSVTAPNAAFYNYTCNSQSNTFKLGDYSGKCTMLVNGCNNEDGLGFVFTNSNFSPRLRLEAQLKKAKYPSERTIYEDSQGTKGNTYYKRRKAKYFCTGLQPEYIHDFLSLAVGFDNFFIDGVSYFVEDDEYEPEYTEQDNLGQVKILVSEKTQNVVNINCSGETINCNLE